jgi:pimeloyl-ACP methyl ester carboxylesterase
MSSRRPTSHTWYSQRLRLHYLDWGAPPGGGDGTMLLVHGVQDHCRSWDWFAAAFLDRYRVVAPDLRGHGDSEWARGSSYHQLDYVYDLAQLIDQARLAPVTIVAHSMGGSVAALYAGTQPGTVRSLVAIEGVGLWPGWADGQPAGERVRNWMAGNRQLAARSIRRYPDLPSATQRMRRANPHLSEQQARHLTTHGTHRNEDGTYSWKFDNFTHAWGAYGVPRDQIIDLWRAITCPVLLLNSEDGYPHRIGQDGTDGHFQDVEHATIAAAGHWAHHDQLDHVVARCRAFLART